MSKSFVISFCVSLALLPLTAGCAAADAQRSPRTVWQGSTSAEADAARYAGKLRGMSAAELGNEADAVQKAFNTRRNEDSRLRLALFHALAPAPHGDRSRALSLLDVPAGEANGRGRNHPLALLFLPLLQDNRRLDEALASSQLKLREEQKRAEALQQGNEQMRQKLDAIRDIEVKILERPATK